MMGDMIGSETSEEVELIDAFLLASRALVAVAARSLAGMAAEVTLPQYRALVILATQGPQRVTDLAILLDVNPSTASRMIDRLVHKRLVHRRQPRSDRRTLRIDVTQRGREVVDEATKRRRHDIERILWDMPATSRKPLVDAMMAFATAAGERPGTGDPIGRNE